MDNLREKLEALRDNIRKHNSDNVRYVADMKNWVCVHLTKYEPRPNKNGDLCIRTTAMATDYTLPRSSVHVTLNQIVGNVMGGNWDEADIAVLAPYQEIVKKNGNPQEIAAQDTYFIPNPDTGLVLPESAFIVKPNADNNKLFEITAKGATYKTDSYTPEEIEMILSLSPRDKQKYEEYASGNIPDYLIDQMSYYDKRIKTLFDLAKDKQAFKRGLFEEVRFNILNRILRDAVIQMSLEKMGYRYVLAHEDIVSGKFAQIAEENGIRGNSGNKGHSFSLEHNLEIHGCALSKVPDILKSKNAQEIYEYISQERNPLSKELMSCILEDKPLPNIYASYQPLLDERIDFLRRNAEYYPEKAESNLKCAEKLEKEGINGYNPHLDTVLHRHADKITNECNQALDELRKNQPLITELKKRLNGETETEKDDDFDKKFMAFLYGNNERK